MRTRYQRPECVHWPSGIFERLVLDGREEKICDLLRVEEQVIPRSTAYPDLYQRHGSLCWKRSLKQVFLRSTRSGLILQEQIYSVLHHVYNVGQNTTLARGERVCQKKNLGRT